MSQQPVVFLTAEGTVLDSLEEENLSSPLHTEIHAYSSILQPGFWTMFHSKNYYNRCIPLLLYSCKQDEITMFFNFS